MEIMVVGLVVILRQVTMVVDSVQDTGVAAASESEGKRKKEPVTKERRNAKVTNVRCLQIRHQLAVGRAGGAVEGAPISFSRALAGKKMGRESGDRTRGRLE